MEFLPESSSYNQFLPIESKSYIENSKIGALLERDIAAFFEAISSNSAIYHSIFKIPIPMISP